MNGCPRRTALRSIAALAAATFALLWTSAALAGDAGSQLRDRLAFMDSRHAPVAQDVLDARSSKLLANPPAATAALRTRSGPRGS